MKNNLCVNKRIEWIDAVKGLCILLISLSHFGIDSKVSNFFNPFFVCIFYVISGYLFYKSNCTYDFKTFFIKKVKSYIYPYFTLSIIVLILVFFESLIIKNFEILITDFLYFISFTGIMGLWFLPVLFCSEILLYIFVKYLSKKIVILLVMPISFLIPNVYSWLSIYNQFLYVVLSVFIALFYLIIGYYFLKYINFLNFFIDKHKILMFCVGIILLILSYFISTLNTNTWFRGLSFGNPILFFSCSFISIFSIIILCKTFLCKSRFLKYCGKNSLIIMVFHTNPLIDISYLIVSVANKLLGIFNLSFSNSLFIYFAFVIDIILVFVIIYLINSFATFLIKFPNIRKKSC